MMGERLTAHDVTFFAERMVQALSDNLPATIKRSEVVYVEALLRALLQVEDADAIRQFMGHTRRAWAVGPMPCPGDPARR